jgi:hypothetical protein
MGFAMIAAGTIGMTAVIVVDMITPAAVVGGAASTAMAFRRVVPRRVRNATYDSDGAMCGGWYTGGYGTVDSLLQSAQSMTTWRISWLNRRIRTHTDRQSGHVSATKVTAGHPTLMMLELSLA